ncbi:MBL fold metallo-hydrolase [Streptomyces canus]|uniref:MBL fold metallo-hydrolase n=1 Tax=Streptomyces canus TaxID=58343 RepID=UPI0033F1CCE0
MQRLAPGVIRIATSLRDNSYLVEGSDGFTLVDPGRVRAMNLLMKAIGQLGSKPSDIRRIILTHAHTRHVKGADELRRRTGAGIYIHAADRAWLEAGRASRHEGANPVARMLDAMPCTEWAPTSPDVTLQDGNYIDGVDGLRVIHTPGHTPGHIALLHESTRFLLVGDAVYNTGRLSLGPKCCSFAPDVRAASLAGLPRSVRGIGFAHGAPLLGLGAVSFRIFLDRIVPTVR